MTLRVTVDFDEIQRRLDRGVERTQFILANQVLADSNQYAPKLSGDLRRLSQVTNNNESIQWNVPYARRQYYNQFVNYTTQGTGSRWVDVARSRHLGNWISIVEQNIF